MLTLSSSSHGRTSGTNLKKLRLERFLKLTILLTDFFRRAFLNELNLSFIFIAKFEQILQVVLPALLNGAAASTRNYAHHYIGKAC